MIQSLHLPSNSNLTSSTLCLRPLPKPHLLFSEGGILSYHLTLAPHQYNPLPPEGYCTSYALGTNVAAQGHPLRGLIFCVSRMPDPFIDSIECDSVVVSPPPHVSSCRILLLSCKNLAETSQYLHLGRIIFLQSCSLRPRWWYKPPGTIYPMRCPTPYCNLLVGELVPFIKR